MESAGPVDVTLLDATLSLKVTSPAKVGGGNVSGGELVPETQHAHRDAIIII